MPSTQVLTQEPSYAINNATLNFTSNTPLDPSGPVVEQIPTIDYSKLFSEDPVERSEALRLFSIACDEYGFFNIENHGVTRDVLEGALKAMADYFRVEDEETKKKYMKMKKTDMTQYGRNYVANENREYMKMAVHPRYALPEEVSFREALGELAIGLRRIKYGLCKVISKMLGFEEDYIEKKFKFESGFDVLGVNLYPPSYESSSPVGLPIHTDPGVLVSLCQDMDGGLQILTNSGKWIKVSIPRDAILFQVGDQLEILTNGKLKSHYHQVLVTSNKVERTSLVGLHGPDLDALVAPAPEFVDETHPVAYRGLTYRESLEIHGRDLIDTQSCIEDVRLRAI